jgi:hypothetical protein
MYEIVYSRVLQGGTAELPDLLPDLAYSMILPYVGHAAAERAISGLKTSEATGSPPPPSGAADDAPAPARQERL